MDLTQQKYTLYYEYKTRQTILTIRFVKGEEVYIATNDKINGGSFIMKVQPQNNENLPIGNVYSRETTVQIIPKLTRESDGTEVQISIDELKEMDYISCSVLTKGINFEQFYQDEVSIPLGKVISAVKRDKYIELKISTMNERLDDELKNRYDGKADEVFRKILIDLGATATPILWGPKYVMYSASTGKYDTTVPYNIRITNKSAIRTYRDAVVAISKIDGAAVNCQTEVDTLFFGGIDLLYFSGTELRTYQKQGEGTTAITLDHTHYKNATRYKESLIEYKGVSAVINGHRTIYIDHKKEEYGNPPILDLGNIDIDIYIPKESYADPAHPPMPYNRDIVSINGQYDIYLDVLETLYNNRLKNMYFYPVKTEFFGDPTINIGDGFNVEIREISRSGKEYYSQNRLLVTSMVYQIHGTQQFDPCCKDEKMMEKQRILSNRNDNIINSRIKNNTNNYNIKSENEAIVQTKALDKIIYDTKFKTSPNLDGDFIAQGFVKVTLPTTPEIINYKMSFELEYTYTVLDEYGKPIFDINGNRQHKKEIPDLKKYDFTYNVENRNGDIIIPIFFAYQKLKRGIIDGDFKIKLTGDGTLSDDSIKILISSPSATFGVG